MGETTPLARAPWPIAEARWLVEDEVEIAVQVLGRLRGTAKIAKDGDRATHETAAREAVRSHLEGKELVKVVVVPGKLVNFVVR